MGPHTRRCGCFSPFPEMAIEYLREIRTIQRKGPYYLGGYCLGGLVAYEMAQILQYEGEEVALVAMLDTHNFSLASKPLGWFIFLHLSRMIYPTSITTSPKTLAWQARRCVRIIPHSVRTSLSGIWMGDRFSAPARTRTRHVVQAATPPQN